VIAVRRASTTFEHAGSARIYLVAVWSPHCSRLSRLRSSAAVWTATWLAMALSAAAACAQVLVVPRQEPVLPHDHHVRGGRGADPAGRWWFRWC
jgi:hypothetical protein